LAETAHPIANKSNNTHLISLASSTGETTLSQPKAILILILEGLI